MDFNYLTRKLLPDADFNPACFDFSEQEAREKMLWRDERPMPTIEELTIQQDLENKESQVKLAYDSMVTDVYSEMKKVFGTENDASASAFAATYEAMVKRPGNYVDAELGFSNAAEVSAYAEAKLAEADAYGVYRMKRIAKFNAEKQQLLG